MNTQQVSLQLALSGNALTRLADFRGASQGKRKEWESFAAERTAWWSLADVVAAEVMAPRSYEHLHQSIDIPASSIFYEKYRELRRFQHRMEANRYTPDDVYMRLFNNLLCVTLTREWVLKFFEMYRDSYGYSIKEIRAFEPYILELPFRIIRAPRSDELRSVTTQPFEHLELAKDSIHPFYSTELGRVAYSLLGPHSRALNGAKAELLSNSDLREFPHVGAVLARFSSIFLELAHTCFEEGDYQGLSVWLLQHSELNSTLALYTNEYKQFVGLREPNTKQGQDVEAIIKRDRSERARQSAGRANHVMRLAEKKQRLFSLWDESFSKNAWSKAASIREGERLTDETEKWVTSSFNAWIADRRPPRHKNFKGKLPYDE